MFHSVAQPACMMPALFGMSSRSADFIVSVHWCITRTRACDINNKLSTITNKVALQQARLLLGWVTVY